MDNPYTFLIGTVVGFHALGGEVKIKPSTNNPELLMDLKTVKVQFPPHVRDEGTAANILTVRSIRMDRKMLLMAFKGLKDRTAVEYLNGVDLYAKETELLPLEEEEFWVKDLVGMNVFTTQGELVGKVESIIYGGNDILEIKKENDPSGKTILVPFVRDLVPTVDMKEKRVEVIPVPGLLEPQ